MIGLVVAGVALAGVAAAVGSGALGNESGPASWTSDDAGARGGRGGHREGGGGCDHAGGEGRGAFTVADGAVTGSFVSFRVDGSLVRDFATVGNDSRTLLESVSIERLGEPTVRASGARFTLDGGDDAVATVVDAPGAPVMLRSKAGNVVTLSLPEGATATLVDESDDGPAGAIIDYGDAKARLALDGGATASVDGTTVVVTLEPGSSLAFHDGEDPPMGAPHGGPHGHGRGGPGADGMRHRGPRDAP